MFEAEKQPICHAKLITLIPGWSFSFHFRGVYAAKSVVPSSRSSTSSTSEINHSCRKKISMRSQVAINSSCCLFAIRAWVSSLFGWSRGKKTQSSNQLTLAPIICVMKIENQSEGESTGFQDLFVLYPYAIGRGSGWKRDGRIRSNPLGLNPPGDKISILFTT